MLDSVLRDAIRVLDIRPPGTLAPPSIVTGVMLRLFAVHPLRIIHGRFGTWTWARLEGNGGKYIVYDPDQSSFYEPRIDPESAVFDEEMTVYDEPNGKVLLRGMPRFKKDDANIHLRGIEDVEPA